MTMEAEIGRLPCDIASLVCAYALEGEPDLLLVQVARKGDEWAARWLAREYMHALAPTIAFAGKNDALYVACAGGHLAMAQWLVAAFRPTGGSVRNLHSEADIAMCAACENGHLEIAQWLAATFGITAEDVRDGYNYFLREACVRGHLEVAQWMTAAFGLTAEDAGASNGYAAQRAKENGHHEVVQWLATEFGIAVD